MTRIESSSCLSDVPRHGFQLRGPLRGEVSLSAELGEGVAVCGAGEQHHGATQVGIGRVRAGYVIRPLKGYKGREY